MALVCVRYWSLADQLSHPHFGAIVRVPHRRLKKPVACKYCRRREWAYGVVKAVGHHIENKIRKNTMNCVIFGNCEEHFMTDAQVGFALASDVDFTLSWLTMLGGMELHLDVHYPSTSGSD